MSSNVSHTEGNSSASMVAKDMEAFVVVLFAVLAVGLFAVLGLFFALLVGRGLGVVLLRLFLPLLPRSRRPRRFLP